MVGFNALLDILQVISKTTVSFKSCLMVSIQFFLGLSGLRFVAFASQYKTLKKFQCVTNVRAHAYRVPTSMPTASSLPSSIDKTWPNHLSLLSLIVNSDFWSHRFGTNGKPACDLLLWIIVATVPPI